MSSFNTMFKLSTVLSFLAVTTVRANNSIPESYFTDNQGINAAQAGSPMWHMASGSCLPSAAEDGQGHQTNGVDPGADCLVGAYLGKGCPGDSTYRGANVWYNNVPGEPFADIPTYFATAKCGDHWRIYYGVYFKKDVGHKSDWEWAIMKWVPDGSGNWVRNAVVLQVDKTVGGGFYSDIPNTFDSEGDQFEDGNKGRDHPKLYFGKHHHAVHWDKSSNFKSTCPGVGTDDFRSDDFQFWAQYDLRHIDFIDQAWTFGQATNPHAVDICNYGNGQAPGF